MMDNKNYSLLTEVIFLGFSTDRRINIILFVLFFLIYLITVIGNVLIIFVIVSSRQLHTPMYYFLCILSLIDLCNSTSAVPRLLFDLLSDQRPMPFIACATQVYIAIITVEGECLLLAIMAYDRYVAICRPLHYRILMRWSVCHGLVAFLFSISFLMMLPTFISPSLLCNPNQVNHFMCEVLAVEKLACYHTYSSEDLTLVATFICMFIPCVFILGTYICILSSVLKIHSARRSKAISTCTSHVTVVVLFYGTAMIQYFGVDSSYRENQGKYITIIHVIICPMLNPIIYTLNNTDVKETLKKKCLVFFLFSGK